MLHHRSQELESKFNFESYQLYYFIYVYETIIKEIFKSSFMKILNLFNAFFPKINIGHHTLLSDTFFKSHKKINIK